MIKALFTLLVFVVTGCVTRGSVSIERLDMAVTDLQRIVVEALPVGKRSQSQNGREFFSEYFIVRSGDYEEAQDSPLRNFAHILILGDRRPYRIDVVVMQEKRTSSGDYRMVKYDEGLARVITRRIQKTLHKRREDRNIIDDFRVF